MSEHNSAGSFTHIKFVQANYDARQQSDSHLHACGTVGAEFQAFS